MIILNLIQNVALLVALAATYQVLESRFPKKNIWYQILSGLLFGGAGIFGMMTPINFSPGIIFDGRSIILSVSGLFGGPLVAAVAAIMCGAYRLWLGGGGAWVGVSVILESAGLGVVFYFLWRSAGQQIGAFSLWLFGLLVHVIMLAIFLALPSGAGPQVLRQIGLPILFFYPLATMIICQIFLDYERQLQDRKALLQTEELQRTILSTSPVGIGLSVDRNMVWVNDAWKEMFGLGPDDNDGLTINARALYPTQEEFDRVGKVIYGGLKAGEANETDATMIRKDGTILEVHIGMKAVDPSDSSKGTIAAITDITDRKQAEESLKGLLKFLQTLIDSIPNPVFYEDLEGKYLGCNEAFAALVGLPKEEVEGKSVDDLVPKDVADIWHAKDLELFDHPHVQVFQYTMPHPDGTEHALVNHTAPFFNPDGTLAGLIGVIVDITDRLRADEAIRQSEEWYRTLVENSFDGIFIQRGTKIIFANSHLNRMLHYSPGELEGKDHWIIYHPEYQEVSRQRAISRMRGEDFEPQFDVKLQRKDSSTFDGEISARAVTVEGGPGVQVWVRDVSKRRRSEEVQRRLATAVEQASEGIVITDPQGNIQYVNPAYEKITGYSRDEMLGQKPTMLRIAEEDSPTRGAIIAALERGERWSGHLIKKRKDGDTYEEDVTLTPVRDPQGAVLNFVIFKRDVTKEARLQRQLLQAQKMEAIGTLAGGIAHDFNNLLQVTLGYSELLLQEKSAKDPDYADLQKIYQAARSGSELVRNILAFSRKSEPNPVPMDLNREVVHVEKLLQRTIPKMIEIRLDLAVSLERINADPAQIEQIIMNLAVNARDAMGEEGSLTLRTENVTLDEECCRLNVEAKPGDYVLFSVSDTGHGIDKETLQHIFEPFYTTKELGRGTGLGLAMVYGIVKQHDGHIAVSSEVGKGTTFKLYFPAIPSIEENGVEETGIMPAFGTETVLLVDDEDLVRESGRENSQKEWLHRTHGSER